MVQIELSYTAYTKSREDFDRGEPSLSYNPASDRGSGIDVGWRMWYIVLATNHHAEMFTNR